MFRILIYVLIAYFVYRMLRSILLPAPRSRVARRTRASRRHAADFSDVQDADFEDLTPPPPPDTVKPGADRPTRDTLSERGPRAEGPDHRKTGT